MKKWFAFLLMSLLGLAIVVPNAFLSTKNGSSSVVQVENNGEDSQILKDDVIIPDAEKVSLTGESFPGSGTQADPYVLSTAAHLAYLSTNYSYANGTKYFELGADIVLNDGYFEDDGTYHDGGDGKLYEWFGIKAHYFQNDHFDGKGHSIIGIYNDSLFIDGYVPGSGWRYLENCTFKNFSVKNAYVNWDENKHTTTAVGIIFSGQLRSSVFENISCYGKLVRTSSGSSSNTATGGIFGYLTNDLTIKNCSNYANVVASNRDYVGGVAGYAYKGDFSRCCNFGDITGEEFCGGIAGYGRMNFSNCKNEGRIEAKYYEGGIVGCDVQDNWVLSNCENFGDIIGSNYSGGVGGIIGNMSGVISVLNCKNYGSVVGNEVGGISGKIETGTTILIEGCKNFGNVDSCSSSIIGGIVGRIQGFNFKALVIKNCINYANLKSVDKREIGGIIGLMASSVNDTSFIIEGCENRGDIAGGECIGGIFGRIEISSRDYNIINCKNSGFISGSSKVGGIVGNIYGTTSGSYAVFIDSCKNTGDIVCSGVAAGICGSTERYPYFSGNSVINVLNCENYGNIKSSSSPSAGIIYAGPSKGVITRCINKGTITASYYSCGIFYGSNFKVSYCWNDGKCVGSRPSGIGEIIGSTTISCCLCTGNKDISVGASGIYNCISISTKKYYGDDFSAFFMDPVTGKIGLKAVQSVGQFQPTLTLEDLTQLSFTKVA